MTARLSLTLPGPAITAEVSWGDVRAYLRAEGWAPYGDDPATWHKGADRVVAERRPGWYLEDAVRLLADYADVSPGEMLTRIAAGGTAPEPSRAGASLPREPLEPQR